MKKINTKETLKDFAGNDMKMDEGNGKTAPVTIGLVLSNILLSAKEGGKMKLFVLAEKFFKEEEIEVDTADLSLVKRLVETTEMYNNLVTGQTLVMLERKEELTK